ncbi:adenylate/guanylate cyclase domain-containing protein [Parvibaculum sp.]|uniref:CHASE2 domain-containing protein n=1 Tax=Parvibaculum sp. TaxID=2024848 RepID=UPI003210D80E
MAGYVDTLKRGLNWLAQLPSVYIATVTLFIVGAIFLRVSDPFPVKALRFIAFDGYQKIAPAKYDPSLPVRIVDIDEASLKRYGQWPWPRTVMAKLRDKLAEDGAATVAFDVMFAEPDRTSLDRIAAGLPKKAADALIAATGPLQGNDDIFAASIARSPTVLAVTLNHTQSAPGLKSKAGFAIAGDDPRPFLQTFTGAVDNLPQMDAGAQGLGSVNWIPDRDEVVRRVPLMFAKDGEIIPSLAAEALRVAQGASTFVLKSSNASGETAFGQATGLNHVRIGQFEVPTDPDGAVWLKYRPSHPETYIPAWRVISGEVNPDDISGRIIFIGTSAAGLIDLRATPLAQGVPGVEVHAQILEHILTGKFLTRPDYALSIELAIFTVLAIGIATLMLRTSALVAAPISLAIIAALPIGGWFAFVKVGLLFDPLYPALCLFLIVAWGTAYLYRRTEQQRAEVRRAFGQYVSPAVVQELIAHPEKLVLGGEERELTLLFCDVRSFTTISEGLTATELTRFINELLTPLTDIVLASGGTVDKYMGDAIMAFWNAPLDDAEHARHACETARAIAAAMGPLNAGWKAEADRLNRPFKEVRVGVGVNTGICCVGNLGSTQRFDYSAIGDEVNVSSRLEGLSKFYGVTTIVSEAAASKCPDMAFLELDLVQVKGRTKPSRLYTMLDTLGCSPDLYDNLVADHMAMLAKYRNRDWDGAKAAIGLCRAKGVVALETLYNLLEERIAEFRLAPPPVDWDGSFIATEK